jgi:hypothetical protein
MDIILVDEKHNKKYQKILIGKYPMWFYNLPDETDDFFDELEEKYNCSLDFTGGQNFIAWSIYEIDDESLFPIILDEIFNFLKDPDLWINNKKYNL